MTIAAGFVCSDGILLASDTLYSGTGMGAKYARKFWILDHDNVLVVFGGAGTEGALLRARDEIARKLKPGLSRIRVVDMVDAAMKKVADKLPDDPSLKTTALVVIRIKDESVLYENAGGSNMLSPVQHPCQCVGYGQSLGWYFAQSLFREGMSLRWAKVVAAHLVKRCREYSEWCGGDTNLIEIPNSGPARYIDSPSEINGYEQHLEAIDKAMRVVLPDGRANDVTLEARVQAITAAVEQASRQFMDRVVGTGVGLTGPISSVYIRPSPPPEPPQKKEDE